MNLTILEKNVIKILSPISKEYLEAKFKNQLRTYSDKDLEFKLKDLVIKTLFESGVKDKNEDKVVAFLRETLLKDLKTAKFSGLTFEEVELAFSKGVRQEYGIYMGVNIQTMHGWLRSYLNSKERETAIKEFYAKAAELQFGKENRTAPVNPEGQKKVLEMLKDVVKGIPEEQEKQKLLKRSKVKSDRDLFIQKCFLEHYNIWLKKPYKHPRDNRPPVYGTTAGQDTHSRLIEFEGKPVDEVQYAEIKTKEYDKIKLEESNTNTLLEGGKDLKL